MLNPAKNYKQSNNLNGLISQAIEKLNSNAASSGFSIKFMPDNEFVLMYVCVVNKVDQNSKAILEKDVDKYFKDVIEFIKKYIKSFINTQKDIYEDQKNEFNKVSFKEKKEKRDCFVEKISINNRYYIRFLRSFLCE